jgi:hypothetical protein
MYISSFASCSFLLPPDTFVVFSPAFLPIPSASAEPFNARPARPLPNFQVPVDSLALSAMTPLDVFLVSKMRTCFLYWYPLLIFVHRCLRLPISMSILWSKEIFILKSTFPSDVILLCAIVIGLKKFSLLLPNTVSDLWTQWKLKCLPRVSDFLAVFSEQSWSYGSLRPSFFHLK